MGRYPSDETEIVRHNVVDILNRRNDGESCRSIAEDLDVPEWTIWNVMKKTGYDGKIRAKPKRTVRPLKMNTNEMIGFVEQVADIVEIERSVDGCGWIVTIDDLSGEQQRTIEMALRDAFVRWSRWSGNS